MQGIAVHLTMKDVIPVLAALISALALLTGYAYQKTLEREAQIREIRQGIYSRLISNITRRNAITGRLLNASPEYVQAKTAEERCRVEEELSATAWLGNRELTKNAGERTEIIASLCLYGTDEAIDAYVQYSHASAEQKRWNLGELIKQLRHSIYDKTHLDPNDANLAIWNDPKYLKKP